MGEIHAIRKEEPMIASELSDGILLLTLQNPPANALSLAMMQMLLDLLRSAREDDRVRVIVLRSGLKLFTPGTI